MLPVSAAVIDFQARWKDFGTTTSGSQVEAPSDVIFPKAIDLQNSTEVNMRLHTFWNYLHCSSLLQALFWVVRLLHIKLHKLMPNQLQNQGASQLTSWSFALCRHSV